MSTIAAVHAVTGKSRAGKEAAIRVVVGARAAVGKRTAAMAEAEKIKNEKGQPERT